MKLEEFVKKIAELMTPEERKLVEECLKDEECEDRVYYGTDHAYTYYLFFRTNEKVLEKCKEIILKYVKGEEVK